MGNVLNRCGVPPNVKSFLEGRIAHKKYVIGKLNTADMVEKYFSSIVLVIPIHLC